MSCSGGPVRELKSVGKALNGKTAGQTEGADLPSEGGSRTKPEGGHTHGSCVSH